ncbi:dihydroorotate dehydrogenase [Pseudonocardia sp. MH-G8]|uniref:dihydroorotate dehydrogenase n=1 Tax=Pseudonocardia sp. MH-G8 TaxID=1854588 RepID=UPI000BA0A067|nr:dihydroorotate dehydrogenase [Pseudonocardia sp. MH-G8]OZM79468.1 dihydroorotate dehydrogenase B catalytic subunit [Pseudonocardia sp. MH-G8]
MTARIDGVVEDVPEDARPVDLSVRLGDLPLANPVMPASGCFGPELADLLPVHRLGAVVTKTVFAQARPGNPAHRLAESAQGMLNSVGIPSPGTAAFVRSGLPAYQRLGVPVVVSVGGLSEREYWQVAEALIGCPHAALEVNVSCPNLERGGQTLGSDPRALHRVVAGVVVRSAVPVLVKLGPDLTAIDTAARAAEDAGATAVTVCNSFPALAVDPGSRRAKLGHGTGGLSGPAIKPLVLRMVWQVAQAVRIPVIGCGGIGTAQDVAEYLVAGATAVQVGTATFARPFVMTEILRELPALAAELGATRLSDLVGTSSF